MADAAPEPALPEEGTPEFNGMLFKESKEPITDDHFAMCRCGVDNVAIYKQVHNSKYTTCYKDREKGELRMFKIHEPVTVVSADVIFGLKDKFDFQMQCDKGLREMEVRKPLDEHGCDLISYKYKMPVGLKDRDFCMKRSARINGMQQPAFEASGEEAKVYEYIQRSCLDDDVPHRDKHLRAFVFMYNRISVEPEGQHRSCQWFASDPRGKLPEGLVSKALVKAMDKSCKLFIKKFSKLLVADDGEDEEEG